MGATASVVAIAATVAQTASSLSKGSGAGAKQSEADAAGAQATEFKQKAADLYDQLQIPTLDRTPMVGKTWLQDASPEAYSPYEGSATQIQDDPAMAQQQQQYLGMLGQLAKGGLTPADLINLQQIQRAQAGAATAQSQSAIDQLRSRGLGGSGAEYATKLLGNQSAENSTSNLYDQAMKSAMDRQISAITNGGKMAGDIRNQDVDISSKMANIANNFNTQVQNLRTDAARNAASVRNTAQAANLAGRQGVANSNVDTQNTNVDLMNKYAQQDFGNLNTKITGQANAYNGQATNASAQQAALSNQALGADQSMTAGLNGIAGLAKSFNGNNGSSGSSGGGMFNTNTNSSNPSWFSNLVNGTPDNINQPETWTDGQFDIPSSADSWI